MASGKEVHLSVTDMVSEVGASRISNRYSVECAIMSTKRTMICSLKHELLTGVRLYVKIHRMSLIQSFTQDTNIAFLAQAEYSILMFLPILG